MGSQGVDREGTENISVGARTNGNAPELSNSYKRSMAVAICGPANARRFETTRRAGAHRLYNQPIHQALVCERFGKPLHRNKAFRLDAWLSRGWSFNHVGSSELPLE